MSAPYHSIEEKCEDAVTAALISYYSGTLTGNVVVGGTLAGTYVFKGFGMQDIVLPCVCIVAPEAVPLDSATAAHYAAGSGTTTVTGNYTVTVKLSVRSHAQDTARATHQALAANVREFLFRSNMAYLLGATSVTDFSPHYVQVGASVRRIEQDQMITDTEIRITCMPS